MPTERLEDWPNKLRIRDFLMPYHMTGLRVTTTDSFFQVSYFIPPLWYVICCGALPIIGMLAMFCFHGPMHGSWPISIVLVGLAVVAAAGAILVGSVLVLNPLASQRIRLIYDRKAGLLSLPADDMMVPKKDILGIVTLYGWYDLPGTYQHALVSEVSVVYRQRDAAMRTAFVLANKFRGRSIAKKLSAMLGVEYYPIDKRRMAAHETDDLQQSLTARVGQAEGTCIASKLVRGFVISLIAVGVIIASVSVGWSLRLAWFVLHASKAQGCILEMDGDSPVFSFTDASGAIRIRRHPSGSVFYSFEKGQKIAVLYDPDNPQDAQLDSFLTLWIGPLLIGGFGAGSAGFAWLLLFVFERFSKWG